MAYLFGFRVGEAVPEPDAVALVGRFQIKMRGRRLLARTPRGMCTPCIQGQVQVLLWLPGARTSTCCPSRRCASILGASARGTDEDAPPHSTARCISSRPSASTYLVTQQTSGCILKWPHRDATGTAVAEEVRASGVPSMHLLCPVSRVSVAQLVSYSRREYFCSEKTVACAVRWHTMVYAR